MVCAQVQRTLPTHPPTSQPWAGLGFYNIVCQYSSGRGRYGPPLTKSWGTPREGLSVPPRSIGLFGGFRVFFCPVFPNYDAYTGLTRPIGLCLGLPLVFGPATVLGPHEVWEAWPKEAS